MRVLAVMHLQIFEVERQTYRAVCCKGVTPLTIVFAPGRKLQCGRNLTRHWVLSRHVRAWGRYHSRIIGSMGDDRSPLRRRQGGKGSAVPWAPPSILNSVESFAHKLVANSCRRSQALVRWLVQ